MLKKIGVNDSVGTKLAHDITEIRPGEFKGPAFGKAIRSVMKIFADCRNWGRIIST